MILSCESSVCDDRCAVFRCASSTSLLLYTVSKRVRGYRQICRKGLLLTCMWLQGDECQNMPIVIYSITLISGRNYTVNILNNCKGVTLMVFERDSHLNNKLLLTAVNCTGPRRYSSFVQSQKKICGKEKSFHVTHNNCRNNMYKLCSKYSEYHISFMLCELEKQQILATSVGAKRVR